MRVNTQCGDALFQASTFITCMIWHVSAEQQLGIVCVQETHRSRLERVQSLDSVLSEASRRLYVTSCAGGAPIPLLSLRGWCTNAFLP